ncbi:SAVMC3_10250 family protein [Streptomyces sp. NPDC006627]|uniref:SAVMC3_10250 family protein n=1 Tax=Streptomyces sp. NPDC006627 TaxID=3154679 RepID=UPI0033A93255
MRELVYLSDGKLEQFLPTLRSTWRRPKVTLSSPFGGAEFDLAPEAERARLKHLERVTREIEASAKWFADDDISPGSWVAFEAPLNYVVLGGRFANLLMFTDIKNRTADYPTGGRIRLLMHGSARHLLTSRRPPEVEPPNEVDLPVYGDRGSDHELWVEMLVNSHDLLLETLRPEGVEVSPSSGYVRSRRQEVLGDAVRSLINALDAKVHPETAATLIGYARVTACLDFHQQLAPRAEYVRHAYVIASPLYVEYAPRD